MGRLQKSKKHKAPKVLEKTVLFARSPREKCDEPPNSKSKKQQTPRSFVEFMKRKNEGKCKRRNSNGMPENEIGMTKPLTKIPEMRKQKFEPKSDFLARVNRETYSYVQNVQFEEKYGVSLAKSKGTTEAKRADDTMENDEVSAADESFDTDVLSVEANSENITDISLPPPHAEIDSKTSESTISSKKNRKRKRKGSNRHDPLNRKDRIAFGETVHEPPKLSFINKFKPDASKPRNLILSQLFSQQNSKADSTKEATLEAERNRVIGAYRALKARKSSS